MSVLIKDGVHQLVEHVIASRPEEALKIIRTVPCGRAALDFTRAFLNELGTRANGAQIASMTFIRYRLTLQTVSEAFMKRGDFESAAVIVSKLQTSDQESHIARMLQLTREWNDLSWIE